MKKIFFFLSIIALAVFSACSSDDDESTSLSDQTMYVEDSVKVGSNVTIENAFVAYVSRNGYLHAYHVGETTYSQNGSTAKIVVRGRSKALDIITDWGISPSELKSKFNKTPVLDTENNDGTYIVAYEGVECANMLAYGFKNNKLYYALALSSPSDESEILDYLTERYVFSPEQVASYTYGGVDGFDDAHAKTYVLVKLDTSYKYDLMLQTSIMSKQYGSQTSSSSSKAIASQIKKCLPLRIIR